MKTFKKILNGCGKDFHSKKACGERKCMHHCGDGTSLCQSCKGKAIGYVLKTKEMLGFLERLSLSLFEDGEFTDLGKAREEIENKITECKEIIKLAEENGIK